MPEEAKKEKGGKGQDQDIGIYFLCAKIPSKLNSFEEKITAK
jgi:hypothetical protein